MDLISVPEFIDSIRGVAIEGGDVNEDGLHLNLNDGRTLIILGVVYVMQKETMQ